MKKEQFLGTTPQEVRAVDGGKDLVLEGYGAVFNTMSASIPVKGLPGGFREVIEPGAFTAVLRTNPDVKLLLNHDENFVLGRTTAGTLTLHQDSKGLAFRAILPNTQTGRELYESVKRGDMTNCSFSFQGVEDSWTDKLVDGVRCAIRTIKSFANLFDVSVVGRPAYQGAMVQARSMQLAELRMESLYPSKYSPAEVREIERQHWKEIWREAHAIEHNNFVAAQRRQNLLNTIL